jgi:hypothetical protein
MKVRGSGRLSFWLTVAAIRAPALSASASSSSSESSLAIAPLEPASSIPIRTARSASSTAGLWEKLRGQPRVPDCGSHNENQVTTLCDPSKNVASDVSASFKA